MNRKRDPWYVAVGIWFGVALFIWMAIDQIHYCVTTTNAYGCY